jgi:hypothetical protein
MEKKQPPAKKEAMNDRHRQPLSDVLEEPAPGEEGFPKADDAKELPFDLPRD